jgi:hypothetical protein
MQGFCIAGNSSLPQPSTRLLVSQVIHKERELSFVEFPFARHIFNERKNLPWAQLL